MIDNLIAIAQNCKRVEEALFKNGGITCPIRPYITDQGVELEISWMRLKHIRYLMSYQEIATGGHTEERSRHALMQSIRKIVDSIIYEYN